jgi:pyrroline-5-carboxylate reductase
MDLNGSTFLLGMSALTQTISKIGPISFIGAGKMCEAMVCGLLKSGLAQEDDIRVSDPCQQRRAHFEAMGIEAYGDNKAAIDGAGTVVFSHKPQNCSKVFRSLGYKFPADTLAISICAGIDTSIFRHGLGQTQIVRAMPNTPALVQQGMTVWYAHPSVQPFQLEVSQCLFKSFGIEEKVTEERFLDMATALSGTGPAYFLLLAESLIDAGVRTGLPRPQAERLVKQTALGTSIQLDSSNNSPALLRNNITSPEGTTAAALYTAEKGNFRTVVADSVWAAFKRSQGLAGTEEKLDD